MTNAKRNSRAKTYRRAEKVGLPPGSMILTTMGHVTKKDLQRIKVRIPPLPEQRAIAHILGTLDDKIELNRRMSETLEAMAQAFFKSWFMNFDPVVVNALKAGNPIPEKFAARAAHYRENPDALGLPEHILHLFPDRFVDLELGPIPAGWEVKALGNIIELAYGKALKADNRRPGKIPVYGSNGIVGWHNEHLVQGPGIVIGRKGNPGFVTWVSMDFYPIDTTFFVISRLEKLYLHFLYHALREQGLSSLRSDSAVPGLNRNLVYLSAQIVPNMAILDVFEETTRYLFRRVHQADEESRTLAALRDTLLPKLFSAELRAPDAEKILEEMKNASFNQ